MQWNEIREYLSDYIYGEAHPAIAREIDVHLQENPEARQDLERLREELAAYRSLPRPAPPANAVAKALEAARAMREVGTTAPAGSASRVAESRTMPEPEPVPNIIRVDWAKVVFSPISGIAAGTLLVITLLVSLRSEDIPKQAPFSSMESIQDTIQQKEQPNSVYQDNLHKNTLDTADAEEITTAAAPSIFSEFFSKAGGDHTGGDIIQTLEGKKTATEEGVAPQQPVGTIRKRGADKQATNKTISLPAKEVGLTEDGSFVEKEAPLALSEARMVTQKTIEGVYARTKNERTIQDAPADALNKMSAKDATRVDVPLESIAPAAAKPIVEEHKEMISSAAKADSRVSSITSMDTDDSTPGAARRDVKQRETWTKTNDIKTSLSANEKPDKGAMNGHSATVSTPMRRYTDEDKLLPELSEPELHVRPLLSITDQPLAKAEPHRTDRGGAEATSTPSSRTTPGPSGAGTSLHGKTSTPATKTVASTLHDEKPLREKASTISEPIMTERSPTPLTPMTDGETLSKKRQEPPLKGQLKPLVTTESTDPALAAETLTSMKKADAVKVGGDIELGVSVANRDEDRPETFEDYAAARHADKDGIRFSLLRDLWEADKNSSEKKAESTGGSTQRGLVLKADTSPDTRPAPKDKGGIVALADSVEIHSENTPIMMDPNASKGQASTTSDTYAEANREQPAPSAEAQALLGKAYQAYDEGDSAQVLAYATRLVTRLPNTAANRRILADAWAMIAHVRYAEETGPDASLDTIDALAELHRIDPERAKLLSRRFDSDRAARASGAEKSE